VLDADATISALAADPARTALLLDFDGSIAAIVPHADDARPVPGALAVLQRLAASMGLVAIVSGRPVGYLAEHVPVEHVAYVGLYGMERIVNGIRFVDPRATPYVAKVASATAEAQAQFPADLVEPKSGISVTLHWRPAPELAGDMVAAADRLAEKYGLAVLRTRMAIEIRPPIDIDKGAAVRSLVEGYETAAYCGDDYGDIPAFTAMQAAVGDGAITHGIRIGVRSPEMPPELDDVTDVLVDGPEGLVALLARVADEIGEPVAG
jgi:trehalose 6-phosphate phosphatase